MELGSEYNLCLNDLNLVSNNVFRYLSDYSSGYYFDSGRSAIKYVARYLNRDLKVLLPEFICESVTCCFNEFEIVYYRLKKDFTIDIDDLANKMSCGPVVVFLMHYFGRLQPMSILAQVRLLADSSDSLIIEDTTHSIFTKTHTIGDYMVCSLRKWLPIPGGGVLYYNSNKIGIKQPDCPKSRKNHRSYGMVLKDLFIKNGYDCNSEYRKIFSESETDLDNQDEIYKISDFSRFIASSVDVKDLIRIRKQNYNTLAKELEKRGVFPAITLEESETPFVYILRVQDRDKLRTYLMDNKIYCAVHWPFDNYQSNQRPFARKNAEELLSLPIDQRYNDTHIQYLVDVLKRYSITCRF